MGNLLSMKYLSNSLFALLLIVLLQAPVWASDVLTGLVDSQETVRLDTVMDKSGFTKQVRTKTTTYQYLTKEGETITLPYKVKGLVDSRIFKKKHPFLNLVLPMVPGLIWSAISSRI